MMYKVIGKNTTYEVSSLDDAMKFAKLLNEFVTIEGNGMELVGKFGADSIVDGLCPDGTKYSWYKRRIPNETSNRN